MQNPRTTLAAVLVGAVLAAVPTAAAAVALPDTATSSPVQAPAPAVTQPDMTGLTEVGHDWTSWTGAEGDVLDVIETGVAWK